MKLSNIIPVEQQLAEAIDRLARVCVDLNLDLLPGDLLEEDLLEEGLLEENFLGDCFAMLKSIGKGISGSWQGFVDQVKNSKAPTADFLKGLARGTGLAQLTALAKKSGKSVAEVLKEIAKAAAAQGGGHGGYGRGGRGGKANPQLDQRYKDVRDGIREVFNEIYEKDIATGSTNYIQVMNELIQALNSELFKMQQAYAQDRAAGKTTPRNW